MIEIQSVTCGKPDAIDGGVGNAVMEVSPVWLSIKALEVFGVALVVSGAVDGEKLNQWLDELLRNQGTHFSAPQLKQYNKHYNQFPTRTKGAQ